MSKKPANNNLPSLQELQQLQRNLPKLPDSMDPQKKRLIYGLLAVFAVIVLIIGLVYVSKNGVDGLLGTDKSTSSTADDEEANVATETLAEVKNPYKAVDPATALAHAAQQPWHDYLQMVNTADFFALIGGLGIAAGVVLMLLVPLLNRLLKGID